ncbi:hypothetical protein [Robbsia andropogonis]|uniref:hypothetical protein n=1 Tax=Robbsia andropogonis TaxID=28092 RepID=UPI0004631319|nr:hypothetical protein [Robbsia andropogonis]
MNSPSKRDINLDAIVTTIISHEVLAGAESQYEAWLVDARNACRQFKGYLSTDVIKPIPGMRNYTVIIRFASFDELSAWIDSDERSHLMTRMSPFLPKGDKHETRTGLEFWFQAAASQVKHPKPWKQFLVTWSAIFPLTVLVPLLLHPIFATNALLGTNLISKGLVAAVIVFMMVYVVMPRYAKLLARWLYA